MPVTFRGLQIWAAGCEIACREKYGYYNVFSGGRRYKRGRRFDSNGVVTISRAFIRFFIFAHFFFFSLMRVYMLCPVDRATMGTNLNKWYSQVILTSTYNDTEGNEFF